MKIEISDLPETTLSECLRTISPETLKSFLRLLGLPVREKTTLKVKPPRLSNDEVISMLIQHKERLNLHLTFSIGLKSPDEDQFVRDHRTTEQSIAADWRTNCVEVPPGDDMLDEFFDELRASKGLEVTTV